MEVENDLGRFDPLQMELLYYLATAIRGGLRSSGVAPDKLRQATHDLTFEIAAIVDGSAEMEVDGKPLKPLLAFSVDDRSDKLLSVEGGSFMHEYVGGVIDDLFGREDV